MSYTGTKVRLFFESANFCGFLRGGNFPHFPQVPHFPQHVFVRKRGREGEQLWIDMMMEKEVEACQRGFLEGWDVWVTPALIFGQNIHEYICFGKSVDTRLTRQAVFGV